MRDSSSAVGGLKLPASLVRAIREGRWRPPQDSQLLATVFGDQPEDPRFYDLAEIKRQTRMLQALPKEDIYGSATDDNLGATPELMVLIGDLGIDMPIALDYRLSQDEPRVIYLGPEGWRMTAESIGDLFALLNL